MHALTVCWIVAAMEPFLSVILHVLYVPECQTKSKELLDCFTMCVRTSWPLNAWYVIVYAL